MTPVKRIAIGKRIALIRENRNMSQSELAEAISSEASFISRSAINHIEHGRSNLLLELALRVGDALHCSIDDLVAPVTAPIPAARVRRKFFAITPPTWRKVQDKDTC